MGAACEYLVNEGYRDMEKAPPQPSTMQRLGAAD